MMASLIFGGGARNENGVRNPICNQVRLSDGTVVEHDVRLSPHIVVRRIARRDVEADAWVEPLKINVCRVARPSPSRAVSGLSPHKHTCAAGRTQKNSARPPGTSPEDARSGRESQGSRWFTSPLLAEGLRKIHRHCLVARSSLELDFDGRLLLAPLEFINVGIGRRLKGAGLEVEGRARRCRIDEDGLLVGHVFGQRRNGAVPLVAALLAVLPDLLDGHLFLIDSEEDRAGILHVGKGRLLHAAGISIVEDGKNEGLFVGHRIDAPAGVLRPGPVEPAFALTPFALDPVAFRIYRRQYLVGKLLLPAFGRTHDPLHLLVAADLDERGLVARRDNLDISSGLGAPISEAVLRIDLI